MACPAITATRRSPLVFVPSLVKLNSQRYISDILEAELLPWARKHYNGASWTLQHDSAPSHGSKMTQSFILAHIPAFISIEDERPSRSPDLNPLDFSVWSILESKVCRTHDSLYNVKLELFREWALFRQEVLHASCESFPG